MLANVLGEKLYRIITQKMNFDYLNEIRLRQDKPIVVFVKGQAYFLSEEGLASCEEKAIFATKQQIEDIIFRASEFSVYSVNEELKRGFIVLSGGERIGICGSLITEKNDIKTLTNFTSINIRIPHQVKNSSLSAYPYIVNENGIYNTLIISPPGAGKTTFIRDFVYQLSVRNLSYNVLVADERGEIAGYGDRQLNLGKFADVLSMCDKKYAFLQGIRAMNPHIIVTDEIGDFQDMEAVNFASNCGVKIIATIHAETLEDLKHKNGFEYIKNTFQRYVILSNNKGPGTMEGVYNENFSRLAVWG